MGPDPAVAATRLSVRRELADLGPGDTVVVACSGGADSLALLAACRFEARRAGWRVCGVTVDHALQEGSAEVAARVVAQMRRLGAAESRSVRVRVQPGGAGPEAAAREARYAALEQAAERLGARAVLLGHTRDDQAETVLLGLTRGSGARSLAGMRRSFGIFRRPLLDLTRAQTRQACTAEGLSWWDDPHNADPAYTRARVRHRVLPVLERELGPGVAATLARTADALREDADALDALAEAAWGGVERGDGLDVEALRGLPRAVALRVLRRGALQAGAPASELFRGHVLALADLLVGPGGRRVQLPGLVTAERSGGAVRFGRTAVGG